VDSSTQAGNALWEWGKNVRESRNRKILKIERYGGDEEKKRGGKDLKRGWPSPVTPSLCQGKRESVKKGRTEAIEKSISKGRRRRRRRSRGTGHAHSGRKTQVPDADILQNL